MLGTESGTESSQEEQNVPSTVEPLSFAPSPFEGNFDEDLS